MRVPHLQIDAAAALPWVAAITPLDRGFVQVTSEGAALHGTPAANAAGFTGAGVKVGVISDGVDELAVSQGAGELPPGVMVLDAGIGNEGTAMLEIIADLAPGADLLFHEGISSVAAHIQAFTDLANAGANVIAEDIGFLLEPVFSERARGGGRGRDRGHGDRRPFRFRESGCEARGPGCGHRVRPRSGIRPRQYRRLRWRRGGDPQ